MTYPNPLGAAISTVTTMLVLAAGSPAVAVINMDDMGGGAFELLNTALTDPSAVIDAYEAHDAVLETGSSVEAIYGALFTETGELRAVPADQGLAEDWLDAWADDNEALDVIEELWAQDGVWLCGFQLLRVNEVAAVSGFAASLVLSQLADVAYELEDADWSHEDLAADLGSEVEAIETMELIGACIVDIDSLTAGDLYRVNTITQQLKDSQKALSAAGKATLDLLTEMAVRCDQAA